MAIWNCFTLTRGEIMWTNQDKRRFFIGQLLTIYALTLLSFQLQHVHRFQWSNQPGITAFAICNTYELYQAYEDCVHTLKASKESKQAKLWKLEVTNCSLNETKKEFLSKLIKLFLTFHLTQFIVAISYQGNPSWTPSCCKCFYLTIQVLSCSSCFTLSINSPLTSSLGSRNKTIMSISPWRVTGLTGKRKKETMEMPNTRGAAG